LKLLWIKVGRIYNDKAIACDLPSVVFGACKVLDLTSIFVEDVKAFCLARALSLIGQSLVRDKATTEMLPFHMPK